MESHRRSKRPARLNISELPSLPGHRTKSYLRGTSGYCALQSERARPATSATFNSSILQPKTSNVSVERAARPQSRVALYFPQSAPTQVRPPGDFQLTNTPRYFQRALSEFSGVTASRILSEGPPRPR
jgi:hypothetical protein